MSASSPEVASLLGDSGGLQEKVRHDAEDGDLAPTPRHERIWTTLDFARMWVSILVNPSGYILGAALLHLGLGWREAVFAVFVGSSILVTGLIANGVAGARFGIPFPVLARMSFGYEGAKAVAVLRGLIAIYYISINMWIGAEALVKGYGAAAREGGGGGDGGGAGSASGGGGSLPSDDEGVSAGRLISFALYTLLHLAVFAGNGINTMRLLAKWLMPLQLGGLLGILAWSLSSVPLATTLENTNSMVEDRKPWAFPVAVTTVISSWSTMSLNIADISRFATSQRAQALGQLVGFVLPNVAVATIGILTTGAASELYPEKASELWNFVTLLDIWPPVVSVAAALVLSMSILSHNIAANVVSPANDLANLLPSRVSFRAGAYSSILIAACLMPWKILATPGGYIHSFVLAYSTFTGAILGVMLADFFALRRQLLTVPSLYQPLGPCRYSCGFNLIGIASALLAVAPCLPGLVVRLSGNDAALTAPGASQLLVAFSRVYDTAWFVSVVLGGGCCVMLSWCMPGYQGLHATTWQEKETGGMSGTAGGRRGFARINEAEPVALRIS
jgi:NCS1 family nucleobase:cation symporter-1